MIRNSYHGVLLGLMVCVIILSGHTAMSNPYGVEVYETPSKSAALEKQAGIVMEIARGAEGGAGTLEDCRNACIKVFEYVTPEQAPQSCAAAELMFMETWYYEKNYQKAIEDGILFLEKYPNQTRENSMALLFLGMALDQTGDYQQAVSTLQKVFTKDYTAKDSAFGENGQPWDMKQKAARWIRELSAKHNDPDLIGQMQTQYPDYFNTLD